MLSLHPVKTGLVREIAAPDGTIAKTSFTLLSGGLGSVFDGAGHLAGMFALRQNTLFTVYADGRSEILAFDAGNVSIRMTGADGRVMCSSWYPAAHRFSTAERRAALAGYARRLGLGAAPVESAAPNAGCAAPMAFPDFASIGQPDDSPAWRAFDQFYASFVAAHEGGYAQNDANGSPANFGINQGANPDIDVVSLNQADAEQILYQRYWLASGADRLPSALAMVQGDTAINMGVRAANELLAQSGGDTDTYLNLRDEKYRAIAASNPDKAGYLPLWLGRNADLRYLVEGPNNDAGDGAGDSPAYADFAPGRREPDWARPDY